MYHVKADIFQNRLYMSLKGFIRPEEAKQVRDEMLAAIPRLRRGFTIVSDIRESVPAPQKSAEYIQEAQAFAFQNGADKAIRVVKNIVSSMQMKRIQREVGANYKVIEVDSLEAAEQLLRSHQAPA